MEKDAKIYVAGHRGLVGGAVYRALENRGFTNLCGRTKEELDLTDAKATRAFFESEKPNYVVLAAAKVGGIHANDVYPADFIRINLEIQTNVIDAAHATGVKKLLFLGSSCIYPKLAEQPIKEDYLLTGHLEPTNDAYAIAKIAGIFMCKSYNRQYGTRFLAAMPTNIYGPGDNFDPKTSHVLPAMLRKFHEAKVNGDAEVELWGTGSPMREFLYVDDLADGLLFMLENIDPYDDFLFANLGVGEDITIHDLAKLVAQVVGYNGTLRWNTDMPDGTPRKLLDVSRMAKRGWQAKTSLRSGIEQTYAWFQQHTQ